jgi:hypothetical protein
MPLKKDFHVYFLIHWSKVYRLGKRIFRRTWQIYLTSLYRYKEQEKDMHMVFIDLEKAYVNERAFPE